MLIVVPKGRGNWRRTSIDINGGHAQSMLFMLGKGSHGLRVGKCFELGGIAWRIVEVRP